MRSRRASASWPRLGRPCVMGGRYRTPEPLRWQEKEPERPLARREPKFAATVGLSGSGAPSNLRSRSGWTEPPGRRLASRRSGRLASVVHLAAVHLRRGPRPLPPLRASPVEAATSALRRLRRGSLGPCGLRIPATGSALRLLRRPVRSPHSVASTAWSDANCTSAPRSGQPRVSAGQTAYPQVAAVEQKVTKGDAP